MFGRIKSNFNFYKNRDRIPMFSKIRGRSPMFIYSGEEY